MEFPKDEVKNKISWTKGADITDGSPRYTFEGRDPATTYERFQVVIYTERERRYNALLTAVFEREQLILLLSNDKPLTSVREAWQAEQAENYDMEFSHTILRFCEDIWQAQQPEITM